MLENIDNEIVHFNKAFYRLMFRAVFLPLHMWAQYYIDSLVNIDRHRICMRFKRAGREFDETY